jgi:hypothetical protein
MKGEKKSDWNLIEVKLGKTHKMVINEYNKVKIRNKPYICKMSSEIRTKNKSTKNKPYHFLLFFVQFSC